ncbi:MAG TPA: bifunctional diaminohydroxyphosphoribosylaminopyrimidine deaminase/5-amino-6-(5-phosphoribosylamino)uracil reductase RibD [Methylophilaceae bacterium]|nr:bifunctional diaminohydroxyphosphoribosylaminopyrimidine deaminase/5-amino-6-(5-phosphoribosylamino)uracil reductase RibD [Methylophilaceae bacterium]HAJ70995.1 bifunctional diaminohydroxyphosphoribosylaminopyrimidine deaminase/5-amino-6-(5-phosphoribosylamino)uracil reductase RibD [Methylophilaceae bacterium]
MFTASDYVYMSRALQLAERGMYTTSPNPRVGCVIVNNGAIVGEGAHLKAGEPHAEVFALQQAAHLAHGATAYVTLEPCSHHGRTPPCATALAKAGISKVIAAMVDPNPLVAGQGLAYLQSLGIVTQSGLMQVEAQALNLGFISRMEKQKPYVRSKIAASLDGRTALDNGQSQWITSPASRLDVQRWRARSCAIMTGIGTVLADNPNLTVREIDTTRQPLRVVVDSQLQMPLDANVLEGGNTVIAYAHDQHCQLARLQDMGILLLHLPNDQGKVCLKSLLSHLASMQVNELMVEAGQGLNGALAAENLVDELVIYYAPKIMGSAAKGMFAIPSLTKMGQVLALDIVDIRQFGQDIRLMAKLVKAHVD